MPDPLLHYSYSLLLAKALGLNGATALLAAAAGAAPDLDALLHRHRSPSHSLPLSLALLAAAHATGNHAAVVAALLYLLHNLVDLFDGPTPALWPFSQATYHVAVNLEADHDRPWRPRLRITVNRDNTAPKHVELANGKTLTLLAAALAAALLPTP